MFEHGRSPSTRADATGKPPQRYPAVALIAVAVVAYALLSAAFVTAATARLGQARPLGGEFGQYAEQLWATGGLTGQNGEWPAYRMPVMIALLASIFGVTRDPFWVMAIKNLLCFPLWFWAIWQVHRATPAVPKRAAWALIGVLLACPHLMYFASLVDVEEGVVLPLLAALSAGVYLRDHQSQSRATAACLGTMTAALLLTKPATLGVGVLIAAALWLRDGCQRRTAGWLLLPPLLALGLWAGSNALLTGRLTLASAYDGYNVWKGHNPATAQLYPGLSLDSGNLKLPPEVRGVRGQWAQDAVYWRLAKDFMRDHPRVAAVNTGKKAYAFFVDPCKVPRRHFDVEPSRAHRLVNAATTACMVVLRAVQWLALGWAVRRVWQGRYVLRRDPMVQNALFLLCLTVTYATPYLAGFAYTRHVTPWLVPCLFYALLEWNARRTA